VFVGWEAPVRVKELVVSECEIKISYWSQEISVSKLLSQENKLELLNLVNINGLTLLLPKLSSKDVLSPQ